MSIFTLGEEGIGLCRDATRQRHSHATKCQEPWGNLGFSR